MKYETVKPKADKVNGWLSESEGRLLYELARKMKNRGAVVEIGSWQGKSTIYIAAGLLETGASSKFYAVDPHVGSEEHQKNGRVWTYDKFLENIKAANVAERVSPIVDKSTNFAKKMNEPVEFVFIDGAHDYNSVKEDFEMWYPKVMDNGFMAFHDSYAGGGPYKVLKDNVYRSRKFGPVRNADSITYVQKVTRNSFLVFLRNSFLLFMKDLNFLLSKNKITKKVSGKLKNIIKRSYSQIN
jgi:predicted O-methyltransferase YrrM